MTAVDTRAHSGSLVYVPDLDDVAAQWAAARAEEQRLRAALRAEVIAEKRSRGADVTDAELVRRSGVERQTVREWLGKRRRTGSASERFEESP